MLQITQLARALEVDTVAVAEFAEATAMARWIAL